MSGIGRTIRSAKMKARTPPKLMPPFHSPAASGTLPIEHTKLITATIGPISGPQNFARVITREEQRAPERVAHPGGKGACDQQAAGDVDPDRERLPKRCQDPARIGGLGDGGRAVPRGFEGGCQPV